MAVNLKFHYINEGEDVRMKARLELNVGSMFSGKTEALIRSIKRYSYAKKKIQVFKPSIDVRYDDVEVVSHSGERTKAIPIDDIRDIMHHLSIDTEVIGIDEVQLFNKEYTLNVVNTLLRMGITVVCSGLDMTYDGKPFGVVPDLMAIADEVNKLKAVCSDCGEDAYISYRTNDCTEEVQIGGSDSYVPLCRSCWYKRLNRK